MITTSPAVIPPVEDGLAGRLLGGEDPGRAGEDEDRRVDAGGFDDAAFLGDIAEEHGQAAFLVVAVGDVADAAGGPVAVGLGVAAVLGAEDEVAPAGRSAEVEGGRGGGVRGAA